MLLRKDIFGFKGKIQNSDDRCKRNYNGINNIM